MKTIFRSFCSCLAFLLLTSNIQAQLSNVVSSYDLRLNNQHVDYCSGAPSLCMDIQIKATDGAPDFLVGEYTIFLDYNANAISFKSYSSLGFDENVACNILDVASYNPYEDDQNSYLEQNGNGNWNVSNTMQGGFFEDFECSIVTSSVWENIGTVCFYITSSTDQTTNIRFDTELTVINNANASVVEIHNQNNLESFDEYPIQNSHFSVLLEGSYETATNIMNTNLLNDGLLPISQPFNRSPWNYAGAENVASASDFPADVVDWVLVEARDIDDNSIVLEQKAAFLLANGEILDADPSVCRGVVFDEIEEYLPYYFSIKTRNHLAVLSETEIIFPNEMVYDFSNPANVNGGETQLKAFENGVFTLKAGDINSDGRINLNDINVYYDESSALNTYLDSDVNFNGTTSVADFNLFPSEAVVGATQVQY